MHNAQRGIGLLETMMVIVFVAIGIVAIIKFQHTLIYNTNTTQQQANATRVALNKLEQLRDFSTLTTTTGYIAYNDIATGTSTQTVGNTTYSLSWTVTNNASPPYKTLDITVTWTDRTGGSQSIRLVTRVAGADPLNSARIF